MIKFKEILQKPFIKTFFYIGITVTVLVVTAILFYVYYPGATKTYKNQTYSFSFKYPKSWAEEDLTKSGLDKQLIVRVKDEENKASFQVRVEKQEQESAFNPDDLSKELDEKMPKELDNFQKISSEKINVSGKDALEYNYSYSYKTESGETKNTQQKMAILVNSKKVYYLVGQAPKDDFSGIEKDFGRIIQSLIID